jgi:thioredoxin-dependent peroxiredoxin
MRLPIRLTAGLCTLSLVALVLGGGLRAGEKGKGMTLKAGDKAPSFEAVDENGKPWKSSDHVGKKIVVLYFYPADFTGGCTAQACGFRDNMSSLKSKDVEVVGVSGDSAKTHQMFKAHEKLNFTLLADEKGALAKQFGVPVGKGGSSPTIDETGAKGTAPRGATIQRYTAVIDKGGNIAALYAVGNAGGDAKKIAGIVSKLEK